MNRRGFLTFLGLAPLAACAPLAPVAAERATVALEIEVKPIALSVLRDWTAISYRAVGEAALEACRETARRYPTDQILLQDLEARLADREASSAPLQSLSGLL